MEVVTMEKKAFDLMMARYDALVKKVELLKHKANGKRLNKWLTGRVFKILIILMSNLSPKYPPN